MAESTLVFATVLDSPEQLAAIKLLIASLRAFAGTLAGSPVWVFDRTQTLSSQELNDSNVKIIPLKLPTATRNYFFASRVEACARAEALAAGRFASLVWIDPECLILNPPDLFALGQDWDAALRPVHIKNVGLVADEPLNSYWAGIYQVVGLEVSTLTLESFVDRQQIQPYFNTHAFSLNPALGLLQQWSEKFKVLVTDDSYQQRSCQPQLHRIFLFQALLSALLIARLDSDRIRILPASYNYPYNLHARVPKQRRAQIMNALTTLVWEGRDLRLAAIDDIGVEEPLRSWLARRVSE